MGRKKAHTPEEIVAKLRQVEVLAAQGKSVAEAVRSIGVRVELRRSLMDLRQSLSSAARCTPLSLV